MRLTLGLAVVLYLMIEVRSPERFAWLEAFSNHGNKTPIAAKFASPSGVPIAANASPATPWLADWSVVDDDRPFHAGENELFFDLLDQLDTTAAARLKSQAEPVQYAQLENQPSAFRGRPVRIEGIVRRANLLTRPDPPYRKYAELWFELDSAASGPVVVYCNQMPHGTTAGLNTEWRAKAVGLFFKRWVYEAADGLRTAPVVVAANVRLVSAPPAALQERAWPKSIVWLVAGLAVLLFLRARQRLTGFSTSRGRRAFASLPARDAIEAGLARLERQSLGDNSSELSHSAPGGEAPGGEAPGGEVHSDREEVDPR